MDGGRIERVAREAFGFDALRPGQKEAIESVLGGRDTLVVMSTGSGKSAIYQIAGLLLPGATVVVSPLIALQRDQVDDLRGRAAGGAAQINSSIPAAERAAALAELAEDALEFVFLAPEQLANDDVLGELAAAEPSLLVVDEAHCISEWGHDFRPEYLRLGAAAEALGRPPVLALTATAAPPVREEIAERLGLREPEVLVRGFDRPNIRLDVRRFQDGDRKLRALRDHIAAATPPGIVYVATRRAARELAGALCDDGLRAASYHAGMRAGERDDVQERFMDGRPRRRRGHDRVRHGRGQGERALGRPRGDLRVARRLLPGGRPGRARRRARRGAALLPPRGPRAAPLLLRRRPRRPRRARDRLRGGPRRGRAGRAVGAPGRRRR